jgi:hypothetical protein
MMRVVQHVQQWKNFSIWYSSSENGQRQLSFHGFKVDVHLRVPIPWELQYSAVISYNAV